ncbi:hypothetical protein [Clostridium sp. ZBS13]|uniref:hypothetical protein n=1 Tax=Clostridium sp. ZBS13 TaxID=2949971 RepID=UPI0020794F80|nr:hypothetical protein [Clostridium sp. ZBS13]
MGKIIKFYLKIMIKNPLFLIAILINIFLTYEQCGELRQSIFMFSEVYCFGFICSNLFLLISSTYVMYKDYDILNLLENNILKKQLAIIITSFIISILTIFIPMLAIIIFINKGFEYSFNLRGIIDFFIIWNLSNLIASVIGSTVGSICRNIFAMLFSTILYGLFVFELYDPSPNILYKLFNIFSDSTLMGGNYICGEIFNTLYYLDKVFIVLIAALIITISFIVNNNNKRLKCSIFIIAILLGMGSIVYYNNVNRSIATIEYTDLDNIKYNIKSYDMNINISNNIKNTTHIKMNINDDSEEIILLLDKLFKINKVSIDDVDVDFKHENNNLCIKHKFNKGTLVDLLIEYSGNVFVENDLGSSIYYVSNSAVNLPISAFLWYPKINNNYLIDFNVNIQANKKVYSNLNTIDKCDNVYKFQGKSSGVNVFSGDYKEENIDNCEYILQINQNSKYFKSGLEKYISKLNVTKDLSEDDLEFLKSKKFKKVISGVWDINTINNDINSRVQIFEDTLIINEI